MASKRGVLKLMNIQSTAVVTSIMSLVPSHPLDLAAGVCRYFLFWHDLLFLNIVPALLTECEVQISWAKNIYFLQNAEGAGLVPFDCWLCLRGTKMMVLRVENNSGLALKRLVDISMDSLLFSRSNWSL
ncbi:hypothetical protein EJD97_010387 [Solanum chilense]|uniref:Uncharacterized protein n=1 Tax=Solanum chilense TaxID=4083 RepID=A0A6N2BL83_SOLCI|nr:hypothetical protein EJD97_010387 [Solanum chilense]